MRHQKYTTQQDSVKAKSIESCEEYEFQAEESPRTFFTQTPNIVISLKLHPSAFMLYFYYRSIGNCFKKKKTIAEETGLSESTIKRANKELAQTRIELGGKSLIKIVQQRKHDKSDGPNKIIIVDIWRENAKAFENKNLEIKEKIAVGQIEPGGGSKRTCINKNPTKQDRNVKGVPAKRVEEKQGKALKRQRSRVDKKPAYVPKVLQDMEDYGVPPDEQQKIANMGFTEQHLTEACLGMIAKMNKGEDVENPPAWLIHACKKYHSGEWKIGQYPKKGKGK